MLLIIDSETNQVIENMGTNSLYSDGELPNLPELPETQKYIKIHDDSDVSNKIKTAYEYELVFNEDGELVDIYVIKTKQQYKEEVDNNPLTLKAKQKQAIQEQLDNIDKQLTRGTEDLIDLLITKNIITEEEIPTYLKERKTLKKQLRQQLKDI